MAVTTAPIFLEADNVSIAFPAPPHLRARDIAVGGRFQRIGRTTRLLAVDGVSFRLDAGDSLGLLGHNGSGKTTLLRVLSGILPPDTGRVRFAGLLGNALNTTLGFRGEATGRHNIRLKSMIAGCRRRDIPDIVRDVEAFAELGPFLDMPLNTYSAGMRARLAFGIATAFRNDILILDEWLGAGDKRMRERVQQRMSDYVAHASITVLASHSENLLRAVCTRGLVMEHGRPVFFGPIEDAIAHYERQVE